ncbi:hypothetical protein V6N13_091005 [Hibiscus sabdariffa]|uniref:Uncharacterized protein n=1 Tax=Hibiscus sabdariffa TaxID=183260 RepID=A0ABR2R2G7_9ROSI
MEGNSGVPICRCGLFYRLPTPATLFLHPTVVGSKNGWESGSGFCVLNSLASLAISVTKTARLEGRFDLFEVLLTWRRWCCCGGCASGYGGGKKARNG